MKLTGQCKTDFEKWLKDSPIYHKYTYKRMDNDEDIHFYKLADSMKWGVYQDFGENVGDEIELYFDWKSLYKTRQEARTAAVEKFNELYNQNN